MAKNIFELEEYKNLSNVSSGEGRDNILIVDALNLAFRYKHSRAKTFATDYLKTINSLAKSYDAKYVIVTSDWGKSSYRKEIYPEYKGDREAKVANQTEQEQKEFEEFIEEFNRALELVKTYHTVLKFKGVEADDLAAYLSHYTFKDYPGHIWLISSDKDWDMLITDKISRFSYVTRKEYTLENWNEHYEFPLEHLLSIKVLQGGKDNVQGIEQVGEKRAWTIINEYGSAFDIYDALPLGGGAKYIQNINNSGDRILLNYQLIDKITYCKEAIGTDNIKAIDEEMKKCL